MAIYHGARKLFPRGLLIGFLLTVAVLILAQLGLLDIFENWVYDRRAATCQFFAPPPTDKLVHLDIDDGALDAIGKWPWPRATLARIVDELACAQPKALAMDILFADPQPSRVVHVGQGYREIDDDKLFADALRRLGKALVPLSLKIVDTATQPIEQALEPLLENNPELTEAQAPAALKAAGHPITSLDERDFLPARRQAIYQRVRAALQKNSALKVAQLRQLLLPHTDPFITTAAVRELEQAYADATSDLALLRFTRAIPPGMPPLLHVSEALTPVPALAQAAAATAFFDYPPEKGGVIRRVPLFMLHEQRMYPHIGVELAAMMLGASLEDMKFTRNSIEIPRKGDSPVVLPVYTYHSSVLHRAVPMMFDIPWYGTDNWETMYAKSGGGHLSMNAVWDACLTQEHIEANNRQASEALHLLYAVGSPEKIEALDRSPPALNDPSSLISASAAALVDLKDYIEAAQQTKRAEVADDAEWIRTQKLAAAGPALHLVIDENPKLQAQLVAKRAELRARMAGRAILIGWAATSSLADLVTTSIHSRCPGVVIHGTIFNAIMTGRLWRRAPPWANALIVLALGMLTAFQASRLGPARALLGAVLLAAAYTAVNGLLLFDYGNRIFALGTPLVTIAVTWAGCTLARLLVEGWERARIMRRFRNYVDPSLVDYVEAHPDEVRFDGQMREMTVVFTDLEGFTTLTEQMGGKAIALLNEFISVSVPVIRRNQGFLNKLLGDGIMFFFGAPAIMPDHAARAVRTVLELRKATNGLNQSLIERGFAPVSMRAGVSTGEMLVGDAGGVDASDYTVLGDLVNLGSRLEGANKALGTLCLLSGRTVELSGGEFLTRPIGKLRVVGKKNGVMTYEPLAMASEATPKDHYFADLSTTMVNAYLAGNFDVCLEAADKIDASYGIHRLTTIYREQCEIYRGRRDDGFDGTITLTDK